MNFEKILRIYNVIKNILDTVWVFAVTIISMGILITSLTFAGAFFHPLLGIMIFILFMYICADNLLPTE